MLKAQVKLKRVCIFVGRNEAYIKTNIMTARTYTVKAIIDGKLQNLWTGYTRVEARKVSRNYDKKIPFNGPISWIWDNEREFIIR